MKEGLEGFEGAFPNGYSGLGVRDVMGMCLVVLCFLGLLFFGVDAASLLFGLFFCLWSRELTAGERGLFDGQLRKRDVNVFRCDLLWSLVLFLLGRCSLWCPLQRTVRCKETLHGVVEGFPVFGVPQTIHGVPKCI